VHDAKKLETLIAKLPSRSAPAGWRDRLIAAIDAGTQPAEIHSRPSNLPHWLGAGGIVATAAGVAIYFARGGEALVTPRAADGEPSIAVEQDASGRAQRNPARIGVRAMVVIHARRALSLRVYRDGAQFARCPGDARCTGDVNGVSLEFPAPSHGTLHAVAYTVPLPSPRTGWIPSTGDLDADLTLAASMGIKLSMSSAIDVP
jgi:hypothetical protein